MTELRLISSECKCVSAADKQSRDEMAYQVAIEFLNDIANGIVRGPVHVMVSFFTNEYHNRFVEWLHQAGWSYACGVQMGCTRLIQMAVPASNLGLFVHRLESI